jgi:lactoylglutathione lyase
MVGIQTKLTALAWPDHGEPICRAYPPRTNAKGKPPMLNAVKQLSYVIILCNDIERMKAFYSDLLAFPINSESDTTLTFRTGSTLFSLRQRTRDYDGQGVRPELPGVQVAFLVSPDEVDQCYAQLVDKGVTILDPPADQPRGHRTVYFADPEGNMLEIYAEI